MAPKNKNSTPGNPTSGKPVNEDQNATSSNAQDQTLLKALQDLVVRVMDPMQKTDRDQIHLGPEAGNLITALQEFISSIVVRSRSGAKNTVEVSLDEEGDLDGGGEDDKSSSKEDQLPFVSSSESRVNAIGYRNSNELAMFEKPRPTFKEELLSALREHVFNKMPIRLLCFEPHGSCLRIALIERGALFARLASLMKRRIHESEFRPQVIKWESKRETNEEAIKRLISKYAGYAILSHTWLRTVPGEVTYTDWNKTLFNSNDPGYRKLVNFCKAVWKNHGLTFGWMDTVCINKESSSELDESIRSMYNWYSRATICITYLAVTETLPNMHLDPWFTRGWTLQELLAPPVIKFYNVHWKRLVDRTSNDRGGTEIRKQIERATTISKTELDDIRGVPISRRMQLAATREVTREEDTAYSLMGIFDVSISTAYGEGAASAFFRLLQAILISSRDVLDILNWAGKLPSPEPYNSSVLPSSPRYYANRSSNKNLIFQPPTKPLTLTHLGVRVPVILMPGISFPKTSSPHPSVGDFSATVDYNHAIRFFKDRDSIPTGYNLLDRRVVLDSFDGPKTDGHYQLTFAVFNFAKTPNDILLPKTCIAIPLKCHDLQAEMQNIGRHTRIQTSESIVFELSSKSAKQTSNMKYWVIKQDELTKHGMLLVALYL